MAARKGGLESLGKLVKRASTEKAPADSPKMVTLSFEPPKAWMLFCTHSSAKRWSRKPRFSPVRGSSGEFGKPKTVDER